MNIGDILKRAYEWGPLLFGIGFVAPLLWQTMDAASVAAPLGLTTFQFALVIGVLTGMIAKVRGRWI